MLAQQMDHAEQRVRLRQAAFGRLFQPADRLFGIGRMPAAAGVKRLGDAGRRVGVAGRVLPVFGNGRFAALQQRAPEPELRLDMAAVRRRACAS